MVKSSERKINKTIKTKEGHTSQSPSKSYEMNWLWTSQVGMEEEYFKQEGCLGQKTGEQAGARSRSELLEGNFSGHREPGVNKITRDVPRGTVIISTTKGKQEASSSR